MGLGRAASSTRALFEVSGVGLSLVLSPCLALGAEPPNGATHYQAPRGCPARSEWLARLHAQLPPSPGARAAANALPVRIEQRPNDAGATGKGEYRGSVGADGAEARAVRGASCPEVFEALVLVALLSLGGSEDGGSEPTDAAVTGAAVAGDVASADSTEPVDAAALDPRDPGSDHLRWGALGLVLVQSGIAPRPSLDVGAGLIARWSSPGEPWLLLGVYTAAAAQTVRVEGASARFEHAALRAVGCPWRYPITGWLALRPCFGLDVGRCRGQGSDVPVASRNSALWLAARAELRFEFSIHDGLSLGAAGGAALPFIRPRFYFEPGVVAFQVPAFGLEAGAFAAWLF